MPWTTGKVTVRANQKAATNSILRASHNVRPIGSAPAYVLLADCNPDATHQGEPMIVAITPSVSCWSSMGAGGGDRAGHGRIASSTLMGCLATSFGRRKRDIRFTLVGVYG